MKKIKPLNNFMLCKKGSKILKTFQNMKKQWNKNKNLNKIKVYKINFKIKNKNLIKLRNIRKYLSKIRFLIQIKL